MKTKPSRSNRLRFRIPPSDQNRHLRSRQGSYPLRLLPRLSALEKHCPYAAAEISNRLDATDLVHRFETGLIEPADFADEISRVLDLRISYDQFCEIWSSVFMLSNTNAIHFDMVRRDYPLLRYFHDFVLSYEVKAMKPAPAIYQAAIARAQCRPAECFYTDDIPAYVEAARQQGIDAVQFESLAQLERDMATRGVRWS